MRAYLHNITLQNEHEKISDDYEILWRDHDDDNHDGDPLSSIVFSNRVILKIKICTHIVKKMHIKYAYYYCALVQKTILIV